MVGAILDSVVDASTEEKTNGNAELVARNEGTTDLARADLGHVQDDDGGDETNTETSNETTSDNETETRSKTLAYLNCDTDNIDYATSDNGVFATKVVCKITSDDGTEELREGLDKR